MRRLVAVVVAAVVVTACSSDAPSLDAPGGEAPASAPGGQAPADATAELGPGLHAGVDRSRLFETRRSLRLTVRQGDDHDVVLDAIQLGSPLFEPVVPQERGAVVRAGGRPVTMPLPFGAARCDADASAGGPPILIAHVEGEEVRIPLDEHPPGALAELHEAECSVALVLADVGLRLGDRWERTAPRTIAGDVEVLQRRPGIVAVVEGVDGNVIFTVRTPGGADAEVSDDRPEATVPIEITASRCDPHALIEYKRTFIVPVHVRVGDAASVRVDVTAEGDARAALQALLESCLDAEAS